MNADGSEARLVVTTTGNDHWVPAWSPDGGSLMYSADGEENEGELARVDLKSGEVTVLTDNDVHDLMPAGGSTAECRGNALIFSVLSGGLPG